MIQCLNPTYIGLPPQSALPNREPVLQTTSTIPYVIFLSLHVYTTILEPYLQALAAPTPLQQRQALRISRSDVVRPPLTTITAITTPLLGA